MSLHAYMLTALSLCWTCCVNASYIYAIPEIFIICFISTSMDFFSLLYAYRLFHSFPFNGSYIIFTRTACTLYFLDTSFSMMFTYITYPFWECSLSLYKPDQFEINLSVFWKLSSIALPLFTKKRKDFCS